MGIVAVPEYEALTTVTYDLDGENLRNHYPLQDLCREKLRAARIEEAIKHWCDNATRQTQPIAVFITGHACAGKSTFIEKLSRQGALDGFVHVNADDMLSWMLGGMRNSNAI